MDSSWILGVDFVTFILLSTLYHVLFFLLGKELDYYKEESWFSLGLTLYLAIWVFLPYHLIGFSFECFEEWLFYITVFLFSTYPTVLLSELTLWVKNK